MNWWRGQPAIQFVRRRGTQLIGGLFYRPGDAFIPMVGFEWKMFKLMFTYDATTSSLKQYNNGRGAFEFALLRHGFYNEYNGDRRQSMCPNVLKNMLAEHKDAC